MNSTAALNRRPRVLIADDHPTVLQTTAAILSPHFDVIAAVGDGQAVLEEAAKTSPDLFVLNIAMPKLDGLSAARRLVEKHSGCKIVFLTAQDDDDYISEALRIGAQGYVTKQRSQTDLVPALKLVLSGGFFISPNAFVGALESKRAGHIREFYSDDLLFYQHTARTVCTAPANGETVFTFLSNIGIGLVRKELEKQGFDSMRAIRRGQYRVFSFETAMPLLANENRPDFARFVALFSATLRRAVVRSEERGCNMTIISDVTVMLLKHGCGYEVARNFEAVWDTILPNHDRVIECGYPVAQLACKQTREALSKLCKNYSDIVAVAS